ncbi:MAG TPA: hypothetical protein VEG32_12615 [Clostridia bacterium]|nr:hypothetical protein [Clostridia bacterium]
MRLIVDSFALELGEPDAAIATLKRAGLQDKAARQVVYEAVMTGSAVCRAEAAASGESHDLPPGGDSRF